MTMLRKNFITVSIKKKYRKDLETNVEILMKKYEKTEIRNYAKNGNNNMTELEKERIKVCIKIFIIKKHTYIIDISYILELMLKN